MATSTHNPSYSLTEVKDIPILDVCDYLGLSVEKKGKNYWCRVRPEKVPSVILHTGNNTFYDFGNGEHGSNIDLVSYATGKSFADAVQTLGNAFNLKPESLSDIKNRFRVMSNTDYARIGLYADLATKNFTFPVEHFSFEKLMEIELRYKMSMNELRKQHPKVYERVIKEKAIPYVDCLRNQYFLEIWKYYNFLETFKNTYLFYDSEKTVNRFKPQTEELEKAEKALYKACYNTSLKVSHNNKYDPLRIIAQMRSGLLNISLGDHTAEELKRLNPDKISPFKISHDAFFHKQLSDCLSKFPHSATFSWEGVEILCTPESGKVLLGIIKNLSPAYLDNPPKPEYINCKEKATLSFQIDSASSRSLNSPSSTNLKRKYPEHSQT